MIKWDYFLTPSCFICNNEQRNDSHRLLQESINMFCPNVLLTSVSQFHNISQSFLRSSTGTVQWHHVGKPAPLGRWSLGTRPHQSGTWTHLLGNCPIMGQINIETSRQLFTYFQMENKWLWHLCATIYIWVQLQWKKTHYKQFASYSAPT